jgi:hypothetical protein
MLAIAAAVVFGIYLILDLLDVKQTDLYNFNTFAALGFLLLSLYLAGIGSGPGGGSGTGGGRGRRFYGRRPGRG